MCLNCVYVYLEPDLRKRFWVCWTGRPGEEWWEEWEDSSQGHPFFQRRNHGGVQHRRRGGGGWKGTRKERSSGSNWHGVYVCEAERETVSRRRLDILSMLAYFIIFKGYMHGVHGSVIFCSVPADLGSLCLVSNVESCNIYNLRWDMGIDVCCWWNCRNCFS